MAVVSLALFKKHVRADDFADDDEYLEHLLDTAESAVITRPIEPKRNWRRWVTDMMYLPP